MNRIYLDTSVYGGYFDPEFELWSRLLFKAIEQGHYSVIYSKLIDIELAPAPDQVRSLAKNLPQERLELIEISDEAVKLADHYLAENVVGKTSRSDCIHFALATLHNGIY